ncbi:Serologically defined colon cancer antigen 8 homolog [Eumeta japonica]|uniref:Serologically defined colon cancer antigen 8 homolog n=1 Tax=Eumeta variegata TaxID=151549 RepID=A0A4C1YY49_EUMVA|nr:Serologically defined colon cancer antigen 8 homolog [Eumeta japonica]
MGSTNYLGKPRAKNGSVTGSDKDVAAKLRRSKISAKGQAEVMNPFFSHRRPGKLTDYGLKRIPDYTELAYKEAVSKLRYFLSGNYAPSFRSYGGSASIKNLDESDADTDKKYPAYLSTLDYKPKPRLTAKYATLYADSLKNAYTPTSNINVPIGGAPVGGPCDTTNPDVVQFIQKQEEYIEQLERESQYCRDELNNLLGKVKEVISENEHLHDAQKNRIISRMLHSGGSETDDLDDTNGFESDKTELKSKDLFRYHSSDIPHEEQEAEEVVVFHQAGRAEYSLRVAHLRARGAADAGQDRFEESADHAVNKRRGSFRLKFHLPKPKYETVLPQDENNENKRKLASGLVDSTCLDGFKRQIDNLQRDKTMLESQVSKLKQSLEQREDAEVGARHARSDTERKLREDKNGLELEIQRLKEELDAERGRVRELCGEGARRALRERSAAEQRYNAHFDELQHDLAAQYDNVAKLQLDLERQRREENDLKRELSMKTAAVEELRMELKNKTASLQADLAQAHAEKASLEEELANARLALERQQRQAKHETNRQNSEIQSLRQRLDRADADLVHARRENLRLSEQISTLEKELNMKNLSPISPEKNKKEKELSTMIESMENKHEARSIPLNENFGSAAQTVAELESMIHSQNSLMEKLTGECRLLTDKLDDANRRHKAQSRSRTDEPIRTQRDDASRATTRRVRHRNQRESGSSNKQPPVVVGPLTTCQDLDDVQGETVYNLPLMIQQPFLQEKKEPIKVDISVKLIPRPRRKDRKRSNASYIDADEESGVKNSFSMDIRNGDVSLTKKSVEIIAAPEIQNGNKTLVDFKLDPEDKIKVDDYETAKHEHIKTEGSSNKDEIEGESECPLHNEGDVLENTECINTDQKLEGEVIPEDIQNLSCLDPVTNDVGMVEDPEVESIDKNDVDPVVES